ncbi:MAG: pilus assembly protein TadG-related protein [bacterium]
MTTRVRTSIAAIRAQWTAKTGQVLVLFALALVGIFGLVGLAVDVGNLVYTATDVQKLADSSALAAAQDLPGTTAAIQTANSYRDQNGVATLAITFAESNTVIRVTATRHVNFTFLRAIGLTGRDISKTAAARGQQQAVTGYNWENTAPFIIWGGSRTSEVNAGDQNCALHTCVGKSYTFADTGWMGASGTPKAPDWTASGSNNFKGDVDHGNGAPVNSVGDTFSVGGLGSVSMPVVGSIVVIPIVDKATGNSNLRSFHIAAWAIVQVDPGCTKQHCTGTILNPSTTTPPTGWVGGGSTPPPPTLSYGVRIGALIE